jgi:two-component system phosphate regulon response regulator PhoB
LPIIILSESAIEMDRLTGLDSGADDFLVKPISPRELLARIRAVLRRSALSPGAEMLVVGDIEMDLARHLVRRRGGRIKAAATEFRLLEAFMRNPGRVLTREHLLGAAWAHNRDIHARTVDVHIRRLRNALAIAGAPDPIRTVRSTGYSLDFGA